MIVDVGRVVGNDGGGFEGGVEFNINVFYLHSTPFHFNFLQDVYATIFGVCVVSDAI